MTQAPLTIAVAKGYLLEESLKLLDKAGIRFDDDISDSRKLFTLSTDKTVKLLHVRPWDVPEYVEQGAADVGIVGEDVLLEKQNNVYKLLDLKFGVCKLVLAGLHEVAPQELPHNTVIATKYPNSAERYFKKLGTKVKLIKLYGAIELAPITGLSDIICDLTATGKTLQENNLVIIDTIFESTARLIANPVSMTFHYSTICELTMKIKNQLD